MVNDALNTAPKRAFQKTAETIGDLVRIKIAEKITRAASKITTHEDKRKNDDCVDR